MYIYSTCNIILKTYHKNTDILRIFLGGMVIHEHLKQESDLQRCGSGLGHFKWLDKSEPTLHHFDEPCWSEPNWQKTCCFKLFHPGKLTFWTLQVIEVDGRWFPLNKHGLILGSMLISKVLSFFSSEIYTTILGLTFNRFHLWLSSRMPSLQDKL